jgi:DNA-binding transcriptional MocR family regulator
MLDLYVPDTSDGQVTYRTLFEHIRSLILSSQLTPGMRLPSVRVLAKHLCVANVTVQRAYTELANQNLTCAATKGGTWVADRMQPEVLSEMIELASHQQRFRDQDQLSYLAGLRILGSTLPDPNLFDPTELLAEFADLRKERSSLWAYAPAAGSPALVRQVCRLLQTYGVKAIDEQIVITLGATHSLSLASSVLPKGSNVLVEDPRGAKTDAILRTQGFNPIPIRRDASGLDLIALKRLSLEHQPSAIVISTAFHNPTGAAITRDEQLTVLETAQTFGFKIIEVDLFRSIAYEQPVPSALAADGGDSVIYIGSLTEHVAPALRLGFIRCSSGVRSQLVNTMENMVVSLPSYTQVGFARYMESGGLDRHIGRALPRYRARRDALHTALRHYMPFASASHPAGGFSSWVELPPADYSGLEAAALKHGISVRLGTSFSSFDDRGYHLRLGFGACETAAIRESVRMLATIIREMLPQSYRGKSA